jgi:hypothetical protein
MRSHVLNQRGDGDVDEIKMVRETEMVREMRERRRYLTKEGDKEINNVGPMRFQSTRTEFVAHFNFRLCFADFSFLVP